jgi:hypothetical protein
VALVVVLGGEEEHAELGAVESAGVAGVNLWRRTYWAGFELIRPSMWANR